MGQDTVMLADEVSMDLLDGTNGETQIEIDGSFFVDTCKKEEFSARILELVEEYCV